MPYTYEYINKLVLSDTVNYTLKIKDSNNENSEYFIPVILNISENTEENLNSVAFNMINKIIAENTPVEKISVPETSDVVSEIIVEDSPIEETLNPETHDVISQINIQDSSIEQILNPETYNN